MSLGEKGRTFRGAAFFTTINRRAGSTDTGASQNRVSYSDFRYCTRSFVVPLKTFVQTKVEDSLVPVASSL